MRQSLSVGYTEKVRKGGPRIVSYEERLKAIRAGHAAMIALDVDPNLVMCDPALNPSLKEAHERIVQLCDLPESYVFLSTPALLRASRRKTNDD